MKILAFIIGVVYFFSFCLMRCASQADKEYERLARKKFYDVDTFTDCTDANNNSEGCTE